MGDSLLVVIVMIERQTESEVMKMPGIAYGITREVGKALVDKALEEIITGHVDPRKEAPVGEEAILAVLSRAAEEPQFLSRLADDPHEALKEYYTLTWEERAALASGDIRKIEGWVGKLDKHLATWLWCRLSQERW